MSNLTTDQAIEDAARDLPDGYVIEINVENGAAGVEMYDPRGNDIALLDQADLTIAEQIVDAVENAIFHANEYQGD